MSNAQPIYLMSMKYLTLIKPLRSIDIATHEKECTKERTDSCAVPALVVSESMLCITLLDALLENGGDSVNQLKSHMKS